MMCLPPLNYRGVEHELVDFYRAVAAASACRSCSTTTPRRAGHDLPPALIARIAAEVEQVVAVKECSGDARRIAALLNEAPTSRCSSAATTGRSRGCAPGATGWVTGVADCAPAECVELYDAVRAADLEPRARSTSACCRSRGST